MGVIMEWHDIKLPKDTCRVCHGFGKVAEEEPSFWNLWGVLSWVLFDEKVECSDCHGVGHYRTPVRRLLDVPEGVSLRWRGRVFEPGSEEWE